MKKGIVQFSFGLILSFSAGQTLEAATIEVFPGQLQAAANSANPGDVILLHAGTYISPDPGRNDTPVLRITRSGTPSARITFKPFGDGPVILDGLGVARNTVEVMADNITLEGLPTSMLEITKGNRRGVLATENPDSITQGGVHNFTARYLYLYGNATGGGGEFAALQVGGPSRNPLIEYCISINNGTGFGFGQDPGSIAPPTGPNDYNANSMITQPINPTIRFCYAYGNAVPGDEGDSDGFVIRGRGVYIQHCVAEFNSDDGFDIEDVTNSPPGIADSPQRSSLVENNVAFQNGWTDTTATGNGQGFKNRFGNGILFRRNIAFFNKSIGFAEDGLNFLKENSHYNNIAYKNGNVGFFFSSKQARSRNNIGLSQ